jgi:uncharacterized repeat protein (TIGR02543 family)
MYNIYYALNGGANAANNPNSYNVASVFPIDIANPSRVGYDFLGWMAIYANGSQSVLTSSFSIPVGTTGDVALYAYWSAMPTVYNITYVLNDGDNAPGNPLVYSVLSVFPISIADPSKDGFVFQGWLATCANGTELMLPDSGIPVGTTGNISLSAVWGRTRGGGGVPLVFSIV